MLSSHDLKPYGAFIEYTIAPILDRCRELIELADEHGLDLNNSLTVAIFLYIIDKVFSFTTTLTVTGIVCYTALSISRLMTP